MLRKVKKRREGKAVTYAHIVAGCRAFDIMHDAGLPENLGLRSLRDMINVYASEVHHGREVMVSVAARGLPKSQTHPGAWNAAHRAHPPLPQGSPRGRTDRGAGAQPDAQALGHRAHHQRGGPPA